MNRSAHLAASIAALIFILALFTPWAAEAQPRSTSFCLVAPVGLPSSGEFLARAWALLSQLWTKEGCGLDPSGVEGGCGLDPSGVEGGCGLDPNGFKEGCGLDPDGLKEGCGLDPNGLDGGCGLDPDGRCIR